MFVQVLFEEVSIMINLCSLLCNKIKLFCITFDQPSEHFRSTHPHVTLTLFGHMYKYVAQYFLLTPL